VGLERGPLSLVSTTEELLGRNSSDFGLENREYGRGDPLLWPRDTLYPQKLALTSPTCGGRSIRIVRLRTKATEFFVIFLGHDELCLQICFTLASCLGDSSTLKMEVTCSSERSVDVIPYKTELCITTAVWTPNPTNSSLVSLLFSNRKVTFLYTLDCKKAMRPATRGLHEQ
jgi:hypothetical protein